MDQKTLETYSCNCMEGAREVITFAIVQAREAVRLKSGGGEDVRDTCKEEVKREA